MTREERVESYLNFYGKYFPKELIPKLRNSMMKLSEEDLKAVEDHVITNPTMIFIVSFFLGGLGIDRFMLGDIGLGFLKLITGGGAGIWWLIDLFKMPKRVKFENMAALYLDVIDAAEGR